MYGRNFVAQMRCRPRELRFGRWAASQLKCQASSDVARFHGLRRCSRLEIDNHSGFGATAVTDRVLASLFGLLSAFAES
jgi:hypothetical protein